METTNGKGPWALKLVSNGYVGKQLEKSQDSAIWSCRNEVTGERYLAFFNFQEKEQQISCNLREAEQFAGEKREVESALELWSQVEVKPAGDVLTDCVPAHGARLFLLGGKEQDVHALLRFMGNG